MTTATAEARRSRDWTPFVLGAIFALAVAVGALHFAHAEPVLVFVAGAAALAGSRG